MMLKHSSWTRYTNTWNTPIPSHSCLKTSPLYSAPYSNTSLQRNYPPISTWTSNWSCGLQTSWPTGHRGCWSIRPSHKHLWHLYMLPSGLRPLTSALHPLHQWMQIHLSRLSSGKVRRWHSSPVPAVTPLTSSQLSAEWVCGVVW